MPQIKIKINKVLEVGTANCKHQKMNTLKFTQLRGLVREGPLREKHWKMNRKFIQLRRLVEESLRICEMHRVSPYRGSAAVVLRVPIFFYNLALTPPPPYPWSRILILVLVKGGVKFMRGLDLLT